MKKQLTQLLLISILCFGGNYACAQTPNTENNNAKQSELSEHKHPSKEEMKKQFEQRLNLTDKQKEKAKIIHQQGRDELKPIIMQINLKKQEIEMVRRSRIAEKAQKEKIEQITSEIQNLEKQAHEIRKKNSQEFEKILNKKQKAELDIMKAEGRARFEQHHKARPPFQGLQSPNLLFKPTLQQPQKDENLWK